MDLPNVFFGKEKDTCWMTHSLKCRKLITNCSALGSTLTSCFAPSSFKTSLHNNKNSDICPLHGFQTPTYFPFHDYIFLDAFSNERLVIWKLRANTTNRLSWSMDLCTFQISSDKKQPDILVFPQSFFLLHGTNIHVEWELTGESGKGGKTFLWGFWGWFAQWKLSLWLGCYFPSALWPPQHLRITRY